MNFLDLPVDVVILILNYLDTKSKINAYNSCVGIREVFAPCHVKRVVLSKSVIATVNALSERLIADLGHHIKVLNLSGVPDLTATSLKPHIDHFHQLVSLDIAFSDVYLPDLLQICPTHLKNISVNFFKCPRSTRRTPIWDQCKALFRSRAFFKIHFVVFEFIDSDTPLMFLEGVPTIQDLKITVADNYRDFWDVEDEDAPPNSSDPYTINFCKLCYLFRECRLTHKTTVSLRGVSNLHFEQIDYIYIMYLEQIVVYVSPIFRSLFQNNCSDFRVEVSPRLPLDFMLDGNIVFKAWNKSLTNFNNDFLKNVLVELTDYFPSYVCMHKGVRMNVTSAPNDWYCIDACDGFENLLPDLPSKITLTDFCRRDGAVIRCKRPIRLTPSNNLRHITFLRLSNVLFKDDFFYVLFSECLRLETLDMYVEKRDRLGVFRGYTKSLSKHMGLARNLKNVKMTSEDVEYEVLFDALSRCASLENVHICEYERSSWEREVDVNCVVAFIERCVNLYSVFVEADMSPEQLTLLMAPIRETVQRLNRDHLWVEVCDCYRGWNPFADVFNPSPLHILD